MPIRNLRRLIEGVIRRQTRCILADPYANAFMPDLASREPLSWSKADQTEMKPGVGERKWEVDSLCYPVRLAHEYWRITHDTRPFDAKWARAMHSILETFTAQQRKTSRGPYSFQRQAFAPTDTLGGDGYGNPARPIGLISLRLPPIGRCVYIPAEYSRQLFCRDTLQRIEEMLTEIAHDSAAASEASLSAQRSRQHWMRMRGCITLPLAKSGLTKLTDSATAICMDDANVPSLLAMPYLGSCTASEPLYLATRRFVLSEANPYFFRGSAAEGIGGPAHRPGHDLAHGDHHARADHGR